jgi:aldehyde:ferredoxin oxidoreductase
MHGYIGRLLVADLDSGRLEEEKLNEEYARDYLGGSGLAVRYLYDLVDADVAPLSPANPLLLMTGPLVGTGAPSCSRYTVSAISPLTGIWGEANSGGAFGPELRLAGYDGLVVKGRATQPTYLSIVNGKAELRDAAHLWGQDTYETQERIREELNEPKARVACIGLAGENQVRYAAIMNDHGRAAGRTGMGTVMGSKKLKAIAVRGTEQVPLANPQTFEELARETTRFVRDDFLSENFRAGGTAIYVDMALLLGDAPAKYWTDGKFEEATELGGATMAETILVGPAACHLCPVACGRRVSLKDTKYGIDEVDGPEYETVISLGALIQSSDLEGVAYAGHLCNLYGMDTISAGSTIALAYYLYDQGVITCADTGGLPLQWGDMDTAIGLIEAIARRDGFGDALAEGAKCLAAHFDASDLAVHVKGLELPMHEPRAFSGQAVSYATSPRGACHLQSDMYMIDMGAEIPELGIMPAGRFKTRGKAAVTARHQDWRSLYNAMIMCHFANPPVPSIAGLLTAATGWERSPHDWQRVGERGFVLKRAFNNRFGVRRGDDRLPQLVLRPISGGTMGRTPRMEKLLESYYAYRQWDWETGKPTPEKLSELGLEQAAEDLWG